MVKVGGDQTKAGDELWLKLEVNDQRLVSLLIRALPSVIFNILFCLFYIFLIFVILFCFSTQPLCTTPQP